MSGNIAALRLKNRLYTGELSSAALQTELADAQQRGAWRQLCGQGASMAQMLGVPELRAVVQDSPAALEDALLRSSAVGVMLQPLLAEPSGALRACLTLDQILASSSAMETLLKSEAALDFIGALPGGNAQVVAAFKQLAGVAGVLDSAISSQAALDLIAADTSAWAALRSSAVLPAAAVPAQTADGSSAAGGAYASGVTGGNSAFRAFDKNAAVYWSANTPAWIAFGFAAPVFVHTVELTSTAIQRPQNARVQRLVGGIWEDVLAVTYDNNASLQTRYPVKAGRAAHWRLYVDSVHAGSGAVQVGELNFIGFQ